jgi:hypothetical protein
VTINILVETMALKCHQPTPSFLSFILPTPDTHTVTMQASEDCPAPSLIARSPIFQPASPDRNKTLISTPYILIVLQMLQCPAVSNVVLRPASFIWTWGQAGEGCIFNSMVDQGPLCWACNGTSLVSDCEIDDVCILFLRRQRRGSLQWRGRC